MCFVRQIWFIGRTLASQAGKAGSTPVICFLKAPKIRGLFIFVLHFVKMFFRAEDEIKKGDNDILIFSTKLAYLRNCKKG